MIGTQRQVLRAGVDKLVSDEPATPVFGPERPASTPPLKRQVSAWRTVAKSLSWRAVGTLDTLILSYILITVIGPFFGFRQSSAEAIQTASYIAVTEVVTKITLYYVHERVWGRIAWGLAALHHRRRETNRRSGVKTATWRTIASLDTFFLAWFYTGNAATAVSIGSLEVATKLVLYFAHERVWARIPFGIAPQSRDNESAVQNPG